MTAQTKSLSWRGSLVIGLLGASAALGGCSMPNSSNPTLTISSARVSADQAQFELLVENSSERNLILTGIDYSVVFGPLSVADGRWEGREDLPVNGSATVRLVTPFTGPVLDPTAGEIELSGEMQFEDQSTKGAMALDGASFRATSRVRR